MKKFLSILLAISLIISMLPMAFADGETAGKEPVETTYKFISDDVTKNAGLISTTNTSPYTVSVNTADGSTYYLNSTYMDYGTTRKWKIFDVSDDLLKTSTDTSQNNNSQFRIYYKADGYLQMNNKAATSLEFAFSLQAPEVEGFYVPAITGYQGAKVTANPYKISITPDIYDVSFNKSVYEKEIPTSYATPSWGNFTQTATNAVYTANTDKIVVALHTDNKVAHRLYSITLNPILNPVMTTTVNGENTVSLDLTDTDTTNDIATASTAVSGKKVVDSTETDVTNMPVSNNFITYKSSDEKVATVDANGTISAVGNGTAKIYAESSDGAYTSEKNAVTVNVTAPVVVEGLSGVTVVYDISGTRDSLYNKLGTTNGTNAFSGKGFSAFSYAETNGFFEYAANSTALTYPAGDKGVFQVRGTDDTGRNGIQINEPGNWIAFKINVPKDGKYMPKATYWKYNTTGELYLDYYLINASAGNMGDLLTDANLTPEKTEYYVGSKSAVSDSGAQVIIRDEAFENYLELEEGEYYLVYRSREVGAGSAYAAFASNFTLDGGAGSVPMLCFKSSADEITAGKTTATVTVSAKLSNPTVTSDGTGNNAKYSYTFSEAPLTGITYSVADDDAEVASVTSAGVVTGKSYGVATINATAKYDGETLSDSLEISVVTPPVLDEEITYGEKDHTGGDANVFTFKAFSTDGESLDVDFDESINITLGEKTNVSTEDTITVGDVKYNFLYWAKGATMAKKQIVSEVAEFDYLPGEGSNFLIAVYEPETETTVTKVEFYNGNGQLLPTYALDNGKYLPDYPSMAGYGTAYGWALKNADGTYTEYRAGDDVSSLTGNLMFAAMYEDLTADITVFVDGTARNVKYGDTVTCTPDSSKGTLMYWMKDGSVVSLDDTYKFLAWEDCRVEAVYGESKPELSATKAMRKIILDRFTAGDETAIMAEFIGFEDAVEKGIMFGNQKIAMSSNSSQFTVLDDATTANTAYAYAIIPSGTVYKMLTDGIAHIGVNEEEILAARRKIAVDYMREMATVLWTPSEDITYTTGASEDSLSFTLEKGRIYRGVPYAYSSGSLETFMEFVGEPNENEVYTVSGLDGAALSGGQGKVRIGNDCSGSVVRSWSKFGANIQAKATKDMTEKNGFIKVGDYDDLGITSYSSSVQTTTITEGNGADVMFAAYAELKPADAVVHYLGGYGHVMMISEVDVANQKVKIIDQTRAHMKTWGTTSEDTMQIDGVGTVYNIYGEDVTYTFKQLYDAGYLPITCRELREANYIADKATFRDTLGEESHTLRNIFRGTIHSTKAIDTVKVEILSDDTVVQNATASVARANIFAFDMQQFVTDNMAAIRGTGIDTVSLASGEYTCKVTVYLTADTVGTEVRNFTFTK